MADVHRGYTWPGLTCSSLVTRVSSLDAVDEDAQKKRGNAMEADGQGLTETGLESPESEPMIGEHERVEAAILKLLGPEGLGFADPRIVALLNISGQAVDAVCGDMLLRDGGILAIIELGAPGTVSTRGPAEGTQIPHPYEDTRLLLVASPSDTESKQTIWIL